MVQLTFIKYMKPVANTFKMSASVYISLNKYLQTEHNTFTA